MPTAQGKLRPSVSTDTQTVRKNVIASAVTPKKKIVKKKRKFISPTAHSLNTSSEIDCKKSPIEKKVKRYTHAHTSSDSNVKSPTHC